MDTLTDKRATHAEIVKALRDLVSKSQHGDVLVFHYSGHGTQVRDTDGDEEDGTDEALVPVDFQDGAFLIDDDLRDIFNNLAPGVNLTCFIDCCHSGSITRMLGRNADDAGDTSHARFLKHTELWEDWMRAHERFREHTSSTRALLTGSPTVGRSQCAALGQFLGVRRDGSRVREQREWRLHAPGHAAACPAT